MEQTPLENDGDRAMLPKLSDLAVVAAGGCCGTTLQLTVRSFTVWLGFEVFLGVMLVNVIGAFALALFTAVNRVRATSPHLTLFFTTGLLGSLTTYSAMVASSFHPVWFCLGIMSGVAAIGLGFWLGDALAAQGRKS